MAKKARATFQKNEKERARQQKQQDKAQRRLMAKAQRLSGTPSPEDDELASGELASDDMRPASQTVPDALP